LPARDEIGLRDHDPSWVGAFARASEEIGAGLSPGVVAGIEHIGSTAVPGLAAKPVVDVLVGVPALPPEQALRERLSALGYDALGEAGAPGRLYFRRREPDAVNVQVVEHGGSHWTHHLLIRDYLRSHPGAARDYDAAKRRAYAQAGGRLDLYTRAKAPAIAAVLMHAWEWRRAGR
jgi:GrpB-like predicted nucleotidyltransferase (UPF0157 family)